MTNPYVPPAPGTDSQEQLAFNRNMRNMIIQKKIGTDGQNIDHMDSKDLKVVLTAIKDQDAQALSQQRLQIENKAVDNAAQRARDIIPHLYQMAGQQMPFQLQQPVNVDPNAPLPFDLPVDPSAAFEVKETMLEVGSPDESYNTFMDRTQPSK